MPMAKKRARGRPKLPMTLSSSQSEELQRWATRRKTAQGLALRARIVLSCAKGTTNLAVARDLHTTPQTEGWSFQPCGCSGPAHHAADGRALATAIPGAGQ